MMNEGPPPPDMIPGLRNLIARLEGYPVSTTNEESGFMIPDYSSSDKLDVLAIMMLINDHDEQITELREQLGNNQASIGFLTIVSLVQVFAIIYLFASK